MSNKHQLVIALGSNVNQERNIERAKLLLITTWKDMLFTSAKWTRPIGMSSDMFYNVLAYTWMTDDLRPLQDKLKEIEQTCGDSHLKRSLSRIEMDIDILQFGEERLHPDDWNRSYIQELMKEIDFDRIDLI